MILAAVLIVPLVAFLLWWAWGPWDEPWHLDDDDYYESPLWRSKEK